MLMIAELCSGEGEAVCQFEIGANKSLITVLFCKDEWRALCFFFKHDFREVKCQRMLLVTQEEQSCAQPVD